VQAHENQVILKILFNASDSEVLDCTGSQESKFLADAASQTNASTEDDSQFYIIEEIEAEETESQKFDESSQDVDIKINLTDENSVKLVENNLTNHAAAKKKKYNRFDCFICKSSLSGNFQFIAHFTKDHPNEALRYQCYVCESQLKSYRSYTRHIESHFEKRFA
jgi:hypothetical protein